LGQLRKLGEAGVLAIPFAKSFIAQLKSTVTELTAPDEEKITLLDRQEWIERYPEFWREAQAGWISLRDPDDKTNYGTSFVLFGPRKP